MKQVLTEQALRVLEPALGEGNVAVSVNLNLDFDKETVHSVEFAPPLEGETQGMILSSEELYDAINPGLIQGAAGQPGTDSNGVSAPEYVSGAEADSGGSYSRTYNYELNRIQTQIEKAQGTVRELSVAVLVNSEVEGASGHLDTMKNLVANAIGVDSDYISVELMPFVERAGEAGFGDYFRQNQEALNKLRQTELLKTIVVSAAALLGLAMVLLYTGRKRRREEAGDELATAGGPAGGPTPGELLNDPEARAEQDRLLQELMHKQSDENERVGELIDRYPDAVIQILRTWLMEEN
ncbi:MAG: hypothetical protein GX585_02835 [Clostridiales bacterium]|nr:hypothetical protein [Clostridiales bacterium]